MYDKLIIIKFLKYAAVGLSGVIVDFAITWLLKEKMRVNKYIANSCGFTFAATGNYVLNRIWTFGSNNPKIIDEYFSFFIVSLVGLGLNNLILWLCVTRLKLNFYLSKSGAIGIVTLWNFVMNYLFTFSN